jgi:hypothetical protein
MLTMRKIVYLIAIIVASTSQLPLNAHAKILKGALKCQGSGAVDNYRLFFGGYRTLTDDEGFFSFPLEFVPSTPLYLLISEGDIWTYDRTNTVATLAQDPQKAYLFYIINYVEDEQGTQTLVATPERLESRNFQIPPECCIVLHLKPNCVAYLSPWRSPAGDTIAHFPKIVLKDMPMAKGRQANLNNLETLDDLLIHEKASENIKLTQNRRQQPVRISVTR